MNPAWPHVPLGELLEQQWRQVPVDPEVEYSLLGAHWYAKGLYTKETKSGAQIRASRLFLVKEEDFVYNRLFAWKGSFAVADAANEGCYVSNEFPCFKISSDRLAPKYLLSYFSREPAWNEALGLSYGATPTSRNRLKESNLLAMKIPLPPLEAQRSIVARIERLAAKIEEAREWHHRSLAEVNALLNSARNRVVEGLRRRYRDVRLGDVCSKITDGPHVSPNYVDVGIPFISVRNITESTIDFGTAKYISSENHQIFSRKAPVVRGDVLYTKGGTTGVARRIDTDQPFSIWVHVALLKLRRDKAEPGFVEHMLNSPTSKAQAELHTRGSTNRDLGLNRMCNITFPSAPLQGQRRIVAHLDGLQAKVDRLKAAQAQTRAELDALLPSILDRAFKGEL